MAPSSDRKRTVVDIPTITGQVPYGVEQAIQRIREMLQVHIGRVEDLEDRFAAQPAPLTLAEIQRELSPTGSYPLPTAALLNTNTPPTSPTTEAPPTPVDDGLANPPLSDACLAQVQAAASSLGIGPSSTDEQMFRFIQTAVQNINLNVTLPAGLVCGLTDAPSSGSNVFTCQGNTYRYGRLTFSNDHSFDVLIDADPGGARTPAWTDNGITAGLYRVATSPTDPC